MTYIVSVGALNSNQTKPWCRRWQTRVWSQTLTSTGWHSCVTTGSLTTSMYTSSMHVYDTHTSISETRRGMTVTSTLLISDHPLNTDYILFFLSDFAAWSSCASTSDSFYDFWCSINMFMYVRMCVSVSSSVQCVSTTLCMDDAAA